MISDVHRYSVSCTFCQDQYVHTLGNLILTRYNSTLSNLSFTKKNRTDNDGNPVGYNNGLNINSYVYAAENWTVVDYEGRADHLVTAALELFRM